LASSRLKVKQAEVGAEAGEGEAPIALQFEFPDAADANLALDSLLEI
jgi:hypothetical protein